jgi:prepilin-type N-terminal cleavage/methylation domain-containing protein
MNFIKKSSGFTLIELSIVMIIIALIVGGIIAGAELIHGAGVRSLVSQVIKYNSAVNLFQMKYQSLPGDFSQASNYLVNTTNGDGNGQIGQVTAGNVKPYGCNYLGSAIIASLEYGNFWQHLYAANLIEYYISPVSASSLISVGVNFPSIKMNPLAGIFAYSNDADQSNYYHLGVNSVTAPSSNTINFLSGYDSFAIDNKIDDGLPTTGIVIARGNNLSLQSYVTSGYLEQQPSYIKQNISSGDVSHCVITCNACGSACNAISYNVAAPVSSMICNLRIKIN